MKTLSKLTNVFSSVKVRIWVLLLLLPVFFSNCSHYYYAPESPNVPLLSEKGDLHVDLKSSFGAVGFDNVELQSAYALGNNIGIMGNTFRGSYVTSARSNVDSTISYRNASGNIHFANLGVGFFTPVGKNFIFETYLGYGIGMVKNSYDSAFVSKLHYHKPFIQPSFGYKTKHFEVAISSRLSILDYNKIVNSESAPSHYVENYIENIRNNRNALLFEPAITIRGGWERVKLQLQMMETYNLSNNLFKFGDGVNIFDHDNNVRWSIGVTYSINTIKKNRENKKVEL